MVRIHQVRKALQFVVRLPNQQGLHHVVERIVVVVRELRVLAIFLIGGNHVSHHDESILELVIRPSVHELAVEVFHSHLHHFLRLLDGSFHALVVHSRLVGCSNLADQFVGEDHVSVEVLGNLVGFVYLGLDVAGLLLELCTLFILQFLVGLVLHELLLLFLQGFLEGNLLGNHLLLHDLQLGVSALQFVGLLQHLEPCLCFLLLVRLALLCSLLGQFVSLSSLFRKGSLHLSSVLSLLLFKLQFYLGLALLVFFFGLMLGPLDFLLQLLLVLFLLGLETVFHFFNGLVEVALTRFVLLLFFSRVVSLTQNGPEFCFCRILVQLLLDVRESLFLDDLPGLFSLQLNRDALGFVLSGVLNDLGVNGSLQDGVLEDEDDASRER